MKEQFDQAGKNAKVTFVVVFLVALAASVFINDDARADGSGKPAVDYQKDQHEVYRKNDHKLKDTGTVVSPHNQMIYDRMIERRKATMAKARSTLRRGRYEETYKLLDAEFGSGAYTEERLLEQSPRTFAYTKSMKERQTKLDEAIVKMGVLVNGKFNSVDFAILFEEIDLLAY